MSYCLRTFASICVLFLCLMGCGGGGAPVAPPKSQDQGCTGIAVAGILHDSLTNLPVERGWVAIESAAAPPSASEVYFSQSQTAVSDATGAFQVCSTSTTQPMVVVIVAQDSAGNAYPPFVEQISMTTNLGTIPMGGCTLLCGLDNQQQTSVPAVINGEITSSPVVIDGYVFPYYAMKSLDGATATIWNVTFPNLSDRQLYMFSTSANGCSEQTQFCAGYTFIVPSQNAVTLTKDGYLQSADAPGYSVLTKSSNSSCTATTMSTYFEKDGKTPLTGSPGSQLSAQNIMFSGCH